MNNVDWMAFLNRMGAMHENHQGLHFGNPERELRSALDGDIVCDLSHLGLIAARGPDAEAFLQGQFSNDIYQVTPQHSQLSAYCNPKGRMLATFRLFQRDNSYYLRMPRGKVEPLLKRLRLYLLRARVTLQDASDEWVRIGLAGPHMEALLQDILGALPIQADDVSTIRGMTVIRLPGIEPRFEIHGELKDLSDLWITLASRVTPVGQEAWRLLDILAGIPTLYPETTEAFIPQMTNMQLINGVSFKKGCYTGQEVVARTHYLGKLKRRMYRAHLDSAVSPKPGDELFSPEIGESQSAGQIVDACPHPNGGYEVLAVVLIDCAEGGTVLLGGENGAALVFKPLPYRFEDSPVSS